MANTTRPDLVETGRANDDIASGSPAVKFLPVKAKMIPTDPAMIKMMPILVRF